MKYLFLLFMIVNFLNAEVKKTYYPNGILESEISLQDSKKEGIEKFYYGNSVLKWEITWRNNKRDGLEREYYKNAQLKSETPYSNDKKMVFRKNIMQMEH